ncbi:oligosaccharide repeat unit polymerase [Synechococcus sp. RS9907]|uniref:oligosaccharide repeat unit polymerase n=1 Tax=Synechococcus sp. RS9907 TaxID=221350 RepID=UPI00165D74DF|nr:oligosaccharide repeat unit polymerase [Synechococcus sp. RS9907]
MFGLDLLDFDQLILVLALIALIGWEVMSAYRSPSPLKVYRPTLFVAGVLLYYVLFGPLQALASGEGLDYRGLDHRDLVVWGWLGALVFYASLLLGFYAKPRAPAPKRLAVRVTPERLHRLGVRLCLLGFVMFAFVGGTRVFALLNPLAARGLVDGGFGEGGVDVGAIANYFNYAINFLIPGILLQAASWLKQRKHTSTLLIWLVSAAGIYVSLGFRYRLVLLAVPLILLWFMARSRRPNLFIVSIFLVAFVLFNGLIGLTRAYGRGLDLTNLEQGIDLYALTNRGVSETGVFLASSGVIEQTPSPGSPYVGLQPLLATVLFPIPRALLPSKPDNSYLTNALSELYGGEIFANGSAVMGYAEYYLIAGFPSLILLSFGLGYLIRRLWNWFLVRSYEPFAQCIYLLSSSYLYVVISRGYMPQVLMLFVFTVAPMFWLYRRWSTPVSAFQQHSVIRGHDHPSLPRQ